MLDAIVARAAREFGEAPAFVASDGWSLSYQDLERTAGSVASGLATTHGVSAGNLVALVLPSTIDYVVAYVALSRLGAVTAGVNPRLTPDEQRRIIAVAEPDLVITTPALVDGVASNYERVVIEPATSVRSLLPSLRASHQPTSRKRADEPAVVVFTSGTTGEPKGAVFTDRQLAAVADADWGVDRWGGGGAMLAATQFAHVGFMTKLPWYLMSGGTTYVLDTWRAADALRLIATHQMASVGGVAPQIALMLRDPSFESYDFSAVQTIVMGGGPSSPALVDEARRRFGAAYSIRYSSTESGGIGTATAFDAGDEEALYTVGRPRPGVEIQIVGDDGRPVPDGEVGELCLRSATMTVGYWRDPDSTNSTLRNGWLHSGDLALVDEAGCIRLAGRRKEMFVRGGYNVFPMEVEAVLASHPGLRDVVVVPRPDDVMGEVGVAVIVPRDPGDPPTLDELRAFAGERLASYKLPEDVRVIDEIPLTPMQKTDRRALAEAEAAAGDLR